MNITQAKAAMRRLIGVKALWRYDEHAPKAEEREAIRVTLPGLQAAKVQAKTALDARRAELLCSDAEYQRLKAEYQAAENAANNATSRAYHYRVTIGRNDGFCMFVMAQGDNWQDAIDKLNSKKSIL